METALLAFVLHIAQALFPKVVQHFRQHSFHRFVPAQQCHIVVVSACDGDETVVSNVHRRAIAVARVGRGILVASLQFRHVISRAQHWRHHQQMHRQHRPSMTTKRVTKMVLTMSFGKITVAQAWPSKEAEISNVGGRTLEMSFLEKVKNSTAHRLISRSETWQSILVLIISRTEILTYVFMVGPEILS